MSEADVATVRGAYDSFNAGNPQGVLDILAEDCAWTEPGGGNSASGTFTGPAEIGEKVLGIVPQYFDDFSVNIDDVKDEDGAVVVDMTFKGKSKSGVELNTSGHQTWKLEDGKVKSVDNKVDDADNWAEAWG